MRKKAVITGMGILAPGGNSVTDWWQANCSGLSHIRRATLCETEGIPYPYAGEVKDFDPSAFFGGKARANRHARNTQLAAVAAAEAIRAAAWAESPLLTRRPVLALLGISMGGGDVTERQIRRLVAGKGVLPTGIACIHLAPLGVIQELIPMPCRLGSLSNTCAGGLDAIAQAAREIIRGETDVAVAGGADAPIVPYIFAGLAAVDALSHHPGPPDKVSRPFDIGRQGGVLAEGAAIVVLEEKNHALARGVTPLAEIGGYGNAVDEGEGGSGLETSMRMAMRESMCMERDIDYINAHAPSDLLIDEMEARAIRRIFGREADQLPVSSIKGMTGNPLAAGGAMQVVSAVRSLLEGRIPPTANCLHPLPLYPLNVVRGASLGVSVHQVLVNSHGMMGINSSLVLRRFGGGR